MVYVPIIEMPVTSTTQMPEALEYKYKS
jgi:hypothetical protein